ncbi:carbohydrate sulfotransferase 15-like [Mizuhopecten yessoensis]|uniref:Carbohydrate sulfotransferase 15 n=1 Tax=Mizuhopecten yessoensis TaxID=6573 RepID=A0A210PUE1_MIZYE|nr:carbohydrate sulfotransferase 15-like [Mizuhopecten yessoensis]XP_021374956.1 carbohydrate sulfotransferase 15-like [Mizuhopecten yessoensis]OWF40119.1 Carbohydrate sulfotransferase 15 [Mizuhopecten yessoensis]
MRRKLHLRHPLCYRRSYVATTLLVILMFGAILGFFQLHNRRLATTEAILSDKKNSLIIKKELLRKCFMRNDSNSGLINSVSKESEKQYVYRNVTKFGSELNSTSFPELQGLKAFEWCSTESSRFPFNSTRAEDLMRYNISFLPRGYKNPCFYDVCSTVGPVPVRALRCLPYFQLIGVDKSGSTDLFARITQHPQILPNSGVLNKETSWWPWTRYGHGLKKIVRRESFDQYLGYFDNAAGQIERNIQVNQNGSNTDSGDFHLLITGDGTPMDFWDFSGWPQIPQNRNQTMPSILTPHLIKHVNPGVKLILVLRDPTERLYSDYLFLKSGVQTPSGFHAAVHQSLRYFNNCTQQKSVRKCLFDRKLHTNVRARLHVSIYSVFLREWLKVFPRKQILIMRSEDYSRNMSSYLKNIFRFLDVVDLAEKDITMISKRARQYETGKKKKVGPMFNNTRYLLDNFFQPFNEELVKILKDDRYLWKDTKDKIKKDLEKLEIKSLRNKQIQMNSATHKAKTRTIVLTKEQALELKPFIDTGKFNSKWL